MPSISSKPRRDDAQYDAREDAVRTKIAAAILHLDRARETVSGEPVRSSLAAASRAMWAAADLLDGVPAQRPGR